MPTDAYCGIDLAFAKNKLLPVAVCTRDGVRISPLPLRRDLGLKPPRGSGNRGALEKKVIAKFVDEVAAYLHGVENRHDVRITTVAIDAPRAPAPEGDRRACEKEMVAKHWPCFPTPSRSKCEEIRQRAIDHLNSGGAISTLPHANQLWMLVGFVLFERLAQEFECIEVFPSAVVRSFNPSVPHKTTQEGFSQQLKILRRGVDVDDSLLMNSSSGARHDRLDALLCAWVASTDNLSRVPYGDGGPDTIWVVLQSAFPDPSKYPRKPSVIA